MKSLLQTTLAMILLVSLSLTGRSQCTVPNYVGGYTGHQLSINENPEYITEHLKSGESKPFYTMNECGSALSMKYKVRIPAGTFQYHVRAYRQNLNCDGSNNGGRTLVKNTPIKNYTGASFYDVNGIFADPSFNGNATYVVETRMRQQLGGGLWTSWFTRKTQVVRFGTSTSVPTPVGFFLWPQSTVSRTSTGTGWTVKIDQLNPNSPVKFNGYRSTCESNHYYTISEFDLNNWQSSHTYSSGWINSTVKTIDLKAAYASKGGFKQGKLYLFTLVTGPGWNPKYYWFEMKNAEVGFKFNSNDIVTQYFLFGQRTFTRYCGTDGVLIYTSGTKYATRYNTYVYKVNNVTGASTYLVSSGWYNSKPPSAINIKNLMSGGGYTIQNNQLYKVTFKVGNNIVSQTKYFMRKTCKKGNEDVSTFVETNEEGEIITGDFNVYPNPTQGQLTIDLQNQDPVKIEVLDMTGRMIRSIPNNVEEQVSIDLSEEKKGMYLIRVIENDKVVVKKVMVQ